MLLACQPGLLVYPQSNRLMRPRESEEPNNTNKKKCLAGNNSRFRNVFSSMRCGSPNIKWRLIKCGNIGLSANIAVLPFLSPTFLNARCGKRSDDFGGFLSSLVYRALINGFTSLQKQKKEVPVGRMKEDRRFNFLPPSCSHNPSSSLFFLSAIKKRFIFESVENAEVYPVYVLF